MNPLKRLQEFGQSVYLDEIRRSWLVDGTLAKLIADDGLRGVTSNPAIFHKAITGSTDYADAIARHARAGDSPSAAYEALVVDDIRDAADLFRETYDSSGGRFGFVSLEVSPELANDTATTVAEGRHLWKLLDRPNVFIKVPGTHAGLDAITQLTRDGINVNVTLLFGLERYGEVIDAYLAGLEQRLADGNPIDDVNSVASFFLSRIDVMIDPLLDAMAEKGDDKAELARSLRGKAAVASAKLAYEIFQQRFGRGDAGEERGQRYAKLSSSGAKVQRLLWASTGTKDPSYPDTKYVEPLIGEDTINTMPLDTLNAYRDHGDPAARVTDGLEEARRVVAELSSLGIELDEVSHKLEEEGIGKFVVPFRELMKAIEGELTGAMA